MKLLVYNLAYSWADVWPGHFYNCLILGHCSVQIGYQREHHYTEIVLKQWFITFFLPLTETFTAKLLLKLFFLQKFLHCR